MVKLEIKVVNVGLSPEFEKQMQDYFHRRDLCVEVVIGTVPVIELLHYELTEGKNIVNAPRRVRGSDVDPHTNSGRKEIHLNTYAADVEDNPEPLYRIVEDQISKYLKSVLETFGGYPSRISAEAFT